MSDRMEECVCANGALVASVVHPYCSAHAHPDVEADAERWRYVRKCFEDPTFSDKDVVDGIAACMPRSERVEQRLRALRESKS